MKAIAACCIWIFGCSLVLADKHPEPNKSEIHSHLLSHSLVFEAGDGGKEPRFVATLTNISNQKLKIRVNDEEFHATLRISSPPRQAYEAYDKKYCGTLLTSTWHEPDVELTPKKSITWIVPLSSLRTLHGKEVTYESLMGRSVVSEMYVVVISAAVIPTLETYFSSTAMRKSKPIVIANK